MNKSSKRIAYIIKTKFVCEEYLNVLPVMYTVWPNTVKFCNLLSIVWKSLHLITTCKIYEIVFLQQTKWASFAHPNRLYICNYVFMTCIFCTIYMCFERINELNWNWFFVPRFNPFLKFSAVVPHCLNL